MTIIHYDPRRFSLTVEGHAGYAATDEKAPVENAGGDIVCSAVSILCYTLAWNLAQAEERGQVKNLVTDFEKGSALLSCTPVKSKEQLVRQLFDAFAAGFRLLEGKYPGCVRVDGEPIIGYIKKK